MDMKPSRFTQEQIIGMLREHHFRHASRKAFEQRAASAVSYGRRGVLVVAYQGPM
jgi:hypothetical protein